MTCQASIPSSHLAQSIASHPSLKPTPYAILHLPSSFGNTAPAVNLWSSNNVLPLVRPQAIFTRPCSVALHFSYINNIEGEKESAFIEISPHQVRIVPCTNLTLRWQMKHSPDTLSLHTFHSILTFFSPKVSRHVTNPQSVTVDLQLT